MGITKQEILSIKNSHFHAKNKRITNVSDDLDLLDAVTVNQLQQNVLKIITKTANFTLNKSYHNYKIYVQNANLITLGNLPANFTCCLIQTDKFLSQLFGNLSIEQFTFNPNLPRFTMNI